MEQREKLTILPTYGDSLFSETNEREDGATLTLDPTPLRFADFLDSDSCRRWVLEQIHPEGPRCPGCDVQVVDITTINNFWAGARCVCKGCGKWFTATTDTFLQGTRLIFEQIFLIVILADYGTAIPHIASATGVSAETIRIWLKRLEYARRRNTY